MNAHTIAEPELLRMFRALPDKGKHQFLQLAIDAMELDGAAERTADLFLADLAWEIADGDEHSADNLYPHGAKDRQTWLENRAKCIRAVLYYERCEAGRSAMLAPVLRVSETSVIA